MRAKLRIFVPLIGCLVVLAVAFAFYQVSVEKRGLQRELDHRAAAVAAGLADAVESALARGAIADLRRIAQRFSNDDRVLGIAIYDRAGMPLAATARLAELTHGTDA